MLSTIAVFLTLVVGSLVLLLVFRSNLQDNLDRTLELQAQDRARLLSDGSQPTDLATPLREESMVWIGTVDGEVLEVAGLLPLENPVPETLNGVGPSTLSVEERKPGEVEVEEMSLRLASATTSDGSIVVLTAAETEIVSNTVKQLALLFAVAVPLLSGLVALLTWRTVGSALAPVDEIRRRTDEVSGTNLSGRVPVPAGQDEISDLALTMNEMLDRLERHRDSLREFTANASHELKSPIANLRMLVETAEVSDPRWIETRNRLVSESDRLRDLVDNLLYLASHAETGSVPASAVVDLDELLFAEAELLSATRQLSIDLNGVHPVMVHGDLADLRRLVRNLVDNAARHAVSTVALAVVSGPDGVLLSVSDDGPGIPADSRARVFERFTRLDEARARDVGGSGLGLAIVQQIAADHGAEVGIVDAALGGAEFRVLFPSELNEAAPMTER